jgi:ATP-binding cassette, subfamily B, bacterial MsbA
LTEEPKKEKKRKPDAFLRSLRSLWPHRKFVGISICCAFLVGGIFTAGLGTMLPLMQVLINGDTIADWVNRKVAEDRLGVRLAEESYEVRPTRIEKKGEAALHQLTVKSAWRIGGDDSSAILARLSDPANDHIAMDVESVGSVELKLKDVPIWYVWARQAAAFMPRNPVAAIASVLGFILGLSIIGNIMRFFQEYLSEKASILAVRDLRKRLYDHCLHLRLGFFSSQGTSDITHRVTQDALGLQEGMKGILGNSIQEPIKAAMALGFAMFLSWQLTLFIVVFAPVMMVIIRKFGKQIRRAARSALQRSAAMLGQIEASLIGIRVVKANNAERFERRRFSAMLSSLVKDQLRIAKLDAFNTPTFEMLTLVVVCCIVLYAAWLVLIQRTLTTSIFFMVMACLVGIGESLRKTTKINNLVQKANASAMRLFEILDMPTERPKRDGSPRKFKSLDPISQSIVFDKIRFTYPGAVNPALCDVTLEVQRGQSIAIVGPNGSGKTTLLGLLPRFYEPDSGEIRIDGFNIANATLPSLRRQIGIVTQDSVIFPGTIAENIAYANPRATRNMIEEAAKRAFADDFIKEKPRSYDTVLGEHGAQLSGGQKQRLCIARAILRQTPILILDEATSQVDAESEALIQRAIESLMHERTTFVIAHRFSTIRSADRIVAMDKGAIVGIGKHEELLENSPLYSRLYEHQM